MMKTNYGSMNFGDWIKCADRLPETGTYLCTMSGELIGSSEPFTGMCGIEGGVWDEPDMVIAWMPLLPPYKEKRMFTDNFFNCNNCEYVGDNDVCKECDRGDSFLPNDELLGR